MLRIAAMLIAIVFSYAVAQDSTLRVLLSSTITSLEPQDSTDADSAAVRANIFNGLLQLTPAGEIVPDLATGWEVSEDGRQYTFTLREGVTFHDGTAFNAAAVVTSFERLLEPDRDTSASAVFKNVLDSVVATGEFQVQFTLFEPDAPFLNNIAHQAAHIMSPAAIAKYGSDVARNPVGTGPYKFVQWVRGERIDLERFDDYFEGTPALAGISYRIIPEAATRAALLETGEADVILRVNPDEAARLEKVPGITLETTATARAMFMAINMTNAPFDDIRVRKAINYAVDVRSLVDALFGPTVPLLDSPMAPGITGYAPIWSYGYEPEKARQLLEEAGYKASDISIDLWAPSGRYVYDSTVAQAVAQELEEFGFDINLRIFGDFAEYLEVSMLPGRGDLIMFGWTTGTLEGHGGMYQVLHGDRANNFANSSGYNNPIFNQLLDDSRFELDQEARWEKYAEAQAIVVEDAPWLFLYPQPVITAYASNVHNLVMMPSEQLLLRNASKD